MSPLILKVGRPSHREMVESHLHRCKSGGVRASALSVLWCDRLLALAAARHGACAGWVRCLVPAGSWSSSECALSARIALERCPSLKLVWPLDCCRIFRNSACIAAPWDFGCSSNQAAAGAAQPSLACPSSHGRFKQARYLGAVTRAIQRRHAYGRPSTRSDGDGWFPNEVVQCVSGP
jgi:hypothetical protein